jgi:tetratricopeptide (TPR) repeat protein
MYIPGKNLAGLVKAVFGKGKKIDRRATVIGALEGAGALGLGALAYALRRLGGSSKPKMVVFSDEEFKYLTTAHLNVMESGYELARWNKFRRRESLMRANRLMEESKRTLDELLGKYPANMAGYALRGMVYNLRGMPDKAVEDFKRGGKPGAVHLAFHYAGNNRIDKAISTLEGALRAETEPIPVRYTLSILVNQKPILTKKGVTPELAIKGLLVKLNYEKDKDFEKAREGFKEVFGIDDANKCRAYLAPRGFFTNIEFYKDILVPRERKPRTDLV